MRGRRVADFGAGSGVAGIAAAIAGAARVTGVDVDPNARAAVLENAEASGLPAGALEVSKSLPAEWDVLLASDIAYETGLRETIDGLRVRAATRGACLLVSEPERPGNPGYATAALERYTVRTFPDVDSPTVSASVYRLA